MEKSSPIGWSGAGVLRHVRKCAGCRTGADDDEPKHMVTAPVNGGAVDGRAIELKYEVTKGAKAHHAQV